MVLAVAMSTSCADDPKADPNIHYINMNCVIVSGDQDITNAKHPARFKYFLIRDTKDTTLYTEYTTINCKTCSYSMSDEFYYNHKRGDTLHFDYILKSRFFRKLR